LTLFELQSQLRDFVAPKFGEVLANQNLAVTDVAGNISDLSKRVEPELKTYFSQLGIELTQFIITSVTLPEEVTAHYDKMTNINMVKDMDKFTQFNTATAIGDGKSGLNDAVQQGAMLNMMMQQMQQNQPVTTQVEDIPAKLKQLKDLFDAGIIEDADFQTKKAELLSKL
jgi:membrane protease subunit (stomatin/prohibitin family)